MVDQVNGELSLAKRLAPQEDVLLADITRIYENFCLNREPPSDTAIARTACIGLTVARNVQSCSYSYISLFLWPWGQWICPIDKSLDADNINKATLLHIFAKAAFHGIPIVHMEEHIVCLMSQIFNDLPPDTCWPHFIKLRDLNGYTSVSGLPVMVFKYFGIDMITWHVYMDTVRLFESTPKNPIFASFIPKWRLRYEQMAKMACDGLSLVCLFEHFVRMIKSKL
jgi:hypothetical protein